MTTEADDLTLTATRIIPAPPARVFAAWLDPVLFRRFMTISDDMSVPEGAIEPRVGGRFSFLVRTASGDAPHAGTYLEIVQDRRLSFTWESPYAAPGSTVTVTFVPVQGGTEVTVTHLKFKSEDSREGHRKGWTAILGNLAKILG